MDLTANQIFNICYVLFVAAYVVWCKWRSIKDMPEANYALRHPLTVKAALAKTKWKLFFSIPYDVVLVGFAIYSASEVLLSIGIEKHAVWFVCAMAGLYSASVVFFYSCFSTLAKALRASVKTQTVEK